jgi:hypothetical protein
MQEEYNYTLTVPLADIELAQRLIQELKNHYPVVRVSRKPDTPTNARCYLSFPYSGTRSDTRFHESSSRGCVTNGICSVRITVYGGSNRT